MQPELQYLSAPARRCGEQQKPKEDQRVVREITSVCERREWGCPSDALVIEPQDVAQPERSEADAEDQPGAPGTAVEGAARRSAPGGDRPRNAHRQGTRGGDEDDPTPQGAGCRQAGEGDGHAGGNSAGPPGRPN